MSSNDTVRLPRFFAPDAPGAGTVRLSDEETHHLRHVLRLPVDAEVRAFDGRGREWHATVARIERRGATLRLVREVAPAREPRVPVTLGVGLLKGEQMDAVVRDATALGAAAIAPLVLDHVATTRFGRGSDRAERATVRWHRVAIAAAKQSGRAVVPTVFEPMTLDDAVDRVAADAIVMAVEPEKTDDTDTAAARIAGRPETTGAPASALLLVGPEGGWSDAEVARMSGRGAQTLSLGPRTLRAETAPVVALAVLWTRWGW